MKRWSCFFALFLCLFLLCGCAGGGSSDPSSDASADKGSDIVAGFSTDDFSSGEETEYLWRVSIPTGPTQDPVPHPYLVFCGKQYSVRKDTPEVERLSSDWSYVGTVSLSVDWRENTYDVDAEENAIVSNCVSQGAKVYQWNYFLAVECDGFFVVFQDPSVS